jgi:dipeptidyl-peptidase-3
MVIQAAMGSSSAETKALAIKAGMTEKDADACMAFLVAFLGNMGNYRSFGDSKIMPAVDSDTLELFFKSGLGYASNAAIVDELLAFVLPRVCDHAPRVQGLGFHPEGVSTYYSSDVTDVEARAVQAVMEERGIHAFNTRLAAETVDGKRAFSVRLASAEAGPATAIDADKYAAGSAVVDGASFEVRFERGDHSVFMRRAAEHLELAAVAAENDGRDGQASIMRGYAASFRSGNVLEHVEASREWVNDRNPAVESYIGFIETYRDPLRVRAEFEGFVACVNASQSTKFGRLVDAAPELLKLMPWPKEFEKDEFQRPDFTSLDILAFASSGVPAGINIPNYDEVRQVSGFKNVSLGNVLAARDAKDRVTFVDDADQELVKTLLGRAFEMHVGLHELLGHGSGKQFREDASTSDASSPAAAPTAAAATSATTSTTFNFDRASTAHPLREGAAMVDSWYKPGQSWDSVFTDVSSAYEECRAECTGLFLCPQAAVLETFEIVPGSEDASDIVYVNWLNMVRAGLVALMFFDPAASRWGQAHMQARYVILRVLLERAPGLVTVHGLESAVAGSELAEGSSGEGVRVTIDRSMIVGPGIEAIGSFLKELQVYKSTADATNGRALFAKFSEVQTPWLKLRDVVLAARKPRPLFVQPVITVDADGACAYKEFPASVEGLIDSFLERFPAKDSELLDTWRAEIACMA